MGESFIFIWENCLLGLLGFQRQGLEPSLEGKPPAMGSNQQCKTKVFSTGRDVILILSKRRPWGGAKCTDKKREKRGKETLTGVRAWAPET